MWPLSPVALLPTAVLLVLTDVSPASACALPTFPHCLPAEGGDDLVLQADVLLLAGTCIVDEAVLTGGNKGGSLSGPAPGPCLLSPRNIASGLTCLPAVPSFLPSTGESTPQWKNPVGEATGDEIDASELEPTSRQASYTCIVAGRQDSGGSRHG